MFDVNQAIKIQAFIIAAQKEREERLARFLQEQNQPRLYAPSHPDYVTLDETK